MPTPLDDREKAYFDTLLNGGNPAVDLKLVLVRMHTVNGDDVAVVCAAVHGTPLGNAEGLMPIAMLLTDDEQINYLRTVDGRAPESFNPEDFLAGDASDPRGPDPDEEIRVPPGHSIKPPFEKTEDGLYFKATCECGVTLLHANDATLLEMVIDHWKASS